MNSIQIFSNILNFLSIHNIIIQQMIYMNIPLQRIWTQPYSNERPIIYSMINNHQLILIVYFIQIINDEKCFLCGSSNHLKAQCSQFQTNPVQR